MDDVNGVVCFETNLTDRERDSYAPIKRSRDRSHVFTDEHDDCTDAVAMQILLRRRAGVKRHLLRPNDRGVRAPGSAFVGPSVEEISRVIGGAGRGKELRRWFLL